MKKKFISLACAAVVLAQAAAAMAEDVAVIVANQTYETLSDAPQVASVETLTPALEAAGYDVVLVEDLSAEGLVEALAAIEGGVEKADDRLLIVLAGHVVEAGGQAFLLNSDAPAVSGFTVLGAGLPLGPVLELAASGDALPVVVVAEGVGSVEVGRGVTNGLTVVEPPEPVTLIAGEPERVIDFVQTEVLRPGRALAEVLANLPPLIAVRGARPDRALVDAPAPSEPEPEAEPDAAATPEPRPEPPAPAPEQPQPTDEEAWKSAEATGSVDAYRGYLAQFPAGIYAQEAQQRLRRLLETPVQRDARLETDAELTDEQLRSIQQHLAALGYYNAGIDGLFGPGTRGGIANWQTANTFDRTGFISPNQISLLMQQAAVRLEELRAQRESEDRQYWSDTGEGADEAGIQAYLALYPEGLFADLANQRLSEIEAERQREARERDQAAWDAAASADTIGAYSRYLESFRDGLFATQAEAAIERIETDRLVEAESARAEAREASLGLDAESRRLLELRLQVLGFATGVVDGTFDEDTREGLAAYQADRGLLPTGFLDQFTLVRLVSEVAFE